MAPASALWHDMEDSKVLEDYSCCVESKTVLQLERRSTKEEREEARKELKKQKAGAARGHPGPGAPWRRRRPQPRPGAP